MPVTPKPDFALPRARTLRLRADFLRLKAEGKRQAGNYLVCNYMIRPGETRLAGFIVPKACGNAVVRNRIKRHLREIYRHLQGLLPQDLHSVWIARKSSATAGAEALRKDVEKILKKAELTVNTGS